MNRNLKLFLMFGPLVIFFIGLAVMVNDARHPVVVEDKCVVTGTGEDAQKARGLSRVIYRQSDNVENDVSLRCRQLGNLMLNDTQLFITPIKSGQGAFISRKDYQILPDRWMVSVYTGKSAK